MKKRFYGEIMSKKNSSSLIIFLLTIFFYSNGYCNNDHLFIETIKQIQWFSVSDIEMKNPFKTFKKHVIETELITSLNNITNIENFINLAFQNKISLCITPQTIKHIESKLKNDLLDRIIDSDRFNILSGKIKFLKTLRMKYPDPDNNHNYPSHLMHDLYCSECNKPDYNCDFISFIKGTLKWEGKFIYCWGTTNFINSFILSQKAIQENTLSSVVLYLDNALKEIDHLASVLPIPNNCSNNDYCNCSTIYLSIFEEYIFIKNYMIIEKGHIMVKNGLYGEAQQYFEKALNMSLNPIIPTKKVPETQILKKKKKCLQLYDNFFKAFCYYFIGQCQTMQKKYDDGLKSFENYNLFRKKAGYVALYSILEPPLSDYINRDVFLSFPDSGLYFDFNSPAKNYSLWDSHRYYQGICLESSAKTYTDYISVYNAYSASLGDTINNIYYHTDALEKIKKIRAILEQFENPPLTPEINAIKFIKPNGQETEWGDILEINQEYLIQIILKAPVALESLKVKYYSDYTSPQPKEWVLNKKANSDGKTFEHKIFVDNNIVCKNDKSKLSFTTLDYVKNSSDSNFEDSAEFISQFQQLGYLNKGTFKDQKATSIAIENLNNPIMPNSVSAMQYAGVEYLKIECYNNFRVIPFACQADILYFSGHGIMKTGNLLIGSTSNNNDITFTPEMVNDHWKSNLKVVIFAGCSVLNMRSVFYIYNTPGLYWKDKGPYLFLGYAGKAPKDMQNNFNTTQKIVKDFVGILKKNNNYKKSWINANAYDYGYNACCIDTINKQFLFFNWNWLPDVNFSKKWLVKKNRFIDVIDYSN